MTKGKAWGAIEVIPSFRSLIQSNLGIGGGMFNHEGWDLSPSSVFHKYRTSKDPLLIKKTWYHNISPKEMAPMSIYCFISLSKISCFYFYLGPVSKSASTEEIEALMSRLRLRQKWQPSFPPTTSSSHVFSFQQTLFVCKRKTLSEK